MAEQGWEVLHGVGVDGVGEILPPLFLFFLRFFAFFCSFFVLVFSFVFPRSPLILLEEGQKLQLTGKMGNFTPTPSAPTPLKTSRQGLKNKSSFELSVSLFV